MAIGVNWAEIWAPVWKTVWTQVVDPPVFSGEIPDITASFNSGTHQYDLSVYFTDADSYAIAPALETGWSFDTNTAVLTIDTDVAGTFGSYVVTATNAGGDTPSNDFAVFVVKTSGGGVVFLAYGWPWHTWKAH